jgi:hypothetical protein
MLTLLDTELHHTRALQWRRMNEIRLTQGLAELRAERGLRLLGGRA